MAIDLSKEKAAKADRCDGPDEAYQWTDEERAEAEATAMHENGRRFSEIVESEDPERWDGMS